MEQLRLIRHGYKVSLRNDRTFVFVDRVGRHKKREKMPRLLSKYICIAKSFSEEERAQKGAKPKDKLEFVEFVGERQRCQGKQWPC